MYHQLELGFSLTEEYFPLARFSVIRFSPPEVQPVEVPAGQPLITETAQIDSRDLRHLSFRWSSACAANVREPLLKAKFRTVRDQYYRNVSSERNYVKRHGKP
jgi:hypothetical protein